MIHIQNPALSLPQNSQDYMAHIFKKHFSSAWHAESKQQMIIFLPFAIVSQLSTYCCIWNRSEACTGLPFASEPLHKQFLTLLPRTFFPPPFPTLSSRNLSGPEVAPLLPGYLPFLLCARAPKQNKVKQNSVWGF